MKEKRMSKEEEEGGEIMIRDREGVAAATANRPHPQNHPSRPHDLPRWLLSWTEIPSPQTWDLLKLEQSSPQVFCYDSPTIIHNDNSMLPGETLFNGQ